MKMRRFFILLVFLFSACDFETLLSPEFDAPVKSFFDTYTNTAAIERHDYSEPPYQDSSRRLCFDSYKDYSVNFYLRNPQLYSLNLEAKFNSLSGVDTSEITVVQSEDKNSITLTLPQKFLVDSDEGKNISPTISLYEPMSGRSFPEYSFELYCNSKPPKVYNPTIINNGNSTFVIAFDMPEVVELVVRHKDLANIIINGASYPLSVDSEGNFNFPDTSRFSTSWKSSYAEIGGKTFNHEDNDRAVYFETGEAFSADDKSYTIVLADAAGLTTEILASTVITKINKPSIYEVQESGREKTLDASKTISLSTLASTEKGSIRIKAPTTDNTGSALLTPVTLYYNIYNGTKKKAVFYNSGSFSGSKDISLAVGTWYVEVYAEATNYESSSPLKCDIRVADNSIYVSASGDDEGDGSASEPFATINGATGLNETGVIHDIISRVAEDAASASKAYTIRVMGALSENVTLSDPLDGDGKLCTTGLNLTGDSGAASDSIASLTVDTTASVPVSLKELTVGSVTVKAGKKLKLYDGAAITNADVEAAGLLAMEGSAKITNLTLADGAYITLTGDLTSERAAEITLASSAYAIGTKILENNSYTEANCAKFKIVDNDPTDTKEWYVKSDGSLSHKVKFGPDEIENITVFENESDIEVTNEKTGFTYKFTAPEGYSYSWKVDGTETGTENVLILNAITWGTGIYDVYLTASKDGKTYSYHAQINHQLVTEFTGTAEECAEYINALTVNETYNVTVTGPVGPGDTDGLMQVANAIRSRHYGIYINLDARGTSNSSDINTYNEGAYFHDCTALKSIKLPTWMKALITNLFAGCTKLETVDIPNEVQQIQTGAFKNCTSITSISLPQKLTGNSSNHGLEAGAFEGCSALTSISYAGDKEEWKNIKFGKSSTSPKTWRDGVPATQVTCSDGAMNLNFVEFYTVFGKLKTGSNYTESLEGSGSQTSPYIFSDSVDSVEIILKTDFVYELKFDTENVSTTALSDGVTRISISDTQRASIAFQTICGTVENTDYKVYFKILKEFISATELNTTNYDSYIKIALDNSEGMTKLIELANSTNAKTFEGKTITLEDDVELSAGQYFATDFKGTFDGNGKKISGLSGVTALFNKVDGGTVKNLTVEGSSTNGGIVSRMTDGLIEGCTSRVNITSTGGSEIGGITGFMISSTVKNCINYGTITGSGDGLGGIVGYMQGLDVIDSCINRGNIQSTANMTGGIVGSAFGLVRNCINIGEVSGTTKVGGIAGKENCGASTSNGVYNCANLAAVTANYQAGGIAGVCDISSSLNYNAIVKNCFNAGSVTRTDTSKESAGGIVGEILTGGSGTCTLTSNYYLPGTAAMGGIGVTNSASVTSPSQSTPSVSDMNTWVNENNSGNVYKTWIIKSVGSTNYPVPDVGYEW